MRTKLFVRDRNKEVRGEIVEFDQFDAIIRDRDVGSWSLKLPTFPSDPNARWNPAEELSKPGAGIIVERDGETLLSGPMRKKEPKWSKDDDTTIISGLTDNWILWNLIVRPSTPNWSEIDGKVFANDAYDVRSGIAETVMKGYVLANTQDGDRRAPGQAALVVAVNQQRGPEVNYRARFQYLGDLLRELGIRSGLGFDIIDNVFEVTEPRDLRGQQVFSVESGNLESFDISSEGPKVTDVLVAGGGEAEERAFVRRRDIEVEAEWQAHIEFFKDERSTVDLIEMTESGDQALIEGAPVSTIDLQAIDVPHRAFGVNWNVSDLATYGDDDLEVLIREAKITLDPKGETVTPTIDSVTTVTARSMIQLYDAVRSLKRRIIALERTR